MNSDLPKVMHTAFGKPLVEWVVDAVSAVGIKRIILVVGHQEEIIRAHFQGRSNIEFVRQSPQLGTGHAVDQARPLLLNVDRASELLVLCGDGPLITPATIATLLNAHRTVHVVDAVPPEEVLSVNTPEQLAEVSNLLRLKTESHQLSTHSTSTHSTSTHSQERH